MSGKRNKPSRKRSEDNTQIKSSSRNEYKTAGLAGITSVNGSLFISFIYCFILLGFRFISSFFPEARLWGFNHAGYFEYYFFIYPIIVLFIIGLYIQRDKLSDIFSDDKFKLSARYHLAISSVVFIVFLGSLYFLSVDNYFLGDSATYIGVLAQNLGLKSIEYGELIIHKIFMSYLDSSSSGSAQSSYRYISILSGAIFIIGYLYYGRKIFNNSRNYLVFILLSLFSSSTLLFFGYVENYSIVSTFIHLFLLSSFLNIKYGNKSLAPVFYFIISFFLHKITVIYLPVLVFYILNSFLHFNLKAITSITKHFVKITVGIIAVVYLVAVYWGDLNIKLIFLHLSTWEFVVDNYTLFSIAHLLDIINITFLIAPFLVLSILIIILNKYFKSLRSADNRLLLLSAITGLIFVFIIEPKIGMARDWDLFSVMLIGAQIFSIILIINIYHQFRYRGIIFIMLLVAQLSIFAPWLTLNNSESKSAMYAKNIFRLDPHHCKQGFWLLVKYYQDKGLMDTAKNINDLRLQILPEIQFKDLGEKYYNTNDFPTAIKYFDKAILANPQFMGPWKNKAYCQYLSGIYEEALNNFNIAYTLSSSSPELNWMIANNYLALGDTIKAVKYLDEGIYYDNKFALIYMTKGDLYYGNNDLDSAYFYYNYLPETSYTLEILFKKGLVYWAKGDTLKARNEFTRYLQYSKDTTIINQINDLLIK